MLQWCLLLTATAIGAGASQREQLFNQQLYHDVLDPGLCRQQLENMHPYEFYDASFRIPQGVLSGSVISLGEYHQCLHIYQQSTVGAIEGKYCMIRFTSQGTVTLPQLSRYPLRGFVTWREFNVTKTYKEFADKHEPSKRLKHDRLIGIENDAWRNFQESSNISVQLALCIPKACSVGDVLGPLTNNPIAPFTYTEQYCRLPDDKPLSDADYCAIVLLFILGLITLLSTGYDLHWTFILKKDPKKRNKLYTCCSVYTNTTRLLTFTSDPASLGCLDGMKSISILWIVMAHVFSNYLRRIHAVNLLEFLMWYRTRKAIWLMSAELSVDTFFTISGLLLVYTALNKLTQKKLLSNIHCFYLYRLLRVLPLLALVVLLQASLFFRVTDGPNWWTLAPAVSHCRQYWWITLLHIQNWVDSNAMCLPQSWYLAVDMQLHIASPVLLYWVLGSRRAAWTTFIVGLGAILAANTVYCFYGKFSDSFENDYYYHTLIRAPPFIIGMMCGYILSIVRGKKLQIPTTIIAMGYLLSVMGSSYAMYQGYLDWSSTLLRDMNNSFVKSLWALSVCWIVFACQCGYAGPINWFLSLLLWKFMARISYAIYMFHLSIIYMYGASFTTPFYYNMENMWFTFAGVTAYTVAAAVAACVLVDAPCSTLQKLMMAGIFNTPVSSTSITKEQHEAPDQRKEDTGRGST